MLKSQTEISHSVFDFLITRRRGIPVCLFVVRSSVLRKRWNSIHISKVRLFVVSFTVLVTPWVKRCIIVSSKECLYSSSNHRKQMHRAPLHGKILCWKLSLNRLSNSWSMIDDDQGEVERTPTIEIIVLFSLNFNCWFLMLSYCDLLLISLSETNEWAREWADICLEYIHISGSCRSLHRCSNFIIQNVILTWGKLRSMSYWLRLI